MPIREKRFLVTGFAIASLLLAACSSTANNQFDPRRHTANIPAQSTVQVPALTVPAQPVCPIVEQAVCEPEPDSATEAAVRKLILGNEWHKEGRYGVALEAYESVLVEHASLLADAYALWGIMALRLDRNNPDYDRDKASTVSYVLNQRIRDALQGEAIAEARLLWFSAEAMLVADVSKDAVVVENRRLQEELAQREEAIQRLRELTVGR